MKHFISTEIIIHAKASTIWQILTDNDKYSEWNPFITKVEGELSEGSKVKALIDGMKFNPLILVCRPNEELKWIGRLLFKGLFDGEHRFQISENTDGSCTLIQSEEFSGILVGLFKKKLDTETVSGFKSMNKALKLRCESIESHLLSTS